MSYFGCTCGACNGKPHCHTAGDCPPETPSREGRRWCVYGGIGCNVDHDAIARESRSDALKIDHAMRTLEFR